MASHNISLPRIYVDDAADRFPYGVEGCEFQVIERAPRAKRRTVTVNAAGLTWLKNDAAHYAGGHVDASPPDILASAKRAHKTLSRIGE